jgi:integrase
MSNQLILAGRPYLNFVNSLRSPVTKNLYILFLKKYMEFCNVTDIEQLLKNDVKLIESQIIDWLVSTREMSYASRSLRLAALMAFYSINDVNLNRRKLGIFLGEESKIHKDRPYTVEEIHRMIDVADERTKVIVLLLASTGMRIGGLVGLKLSHLQKIESYQLYKVTMYENTRDEYICFTTPECAAAIDTYLKYRQRCGEKLAYDSNKGIWLPATTPLVRKEFNRDDPFQAAHPKPITTAKCFDFLIQGLLKKTGIITPYPSIVGTKTRPRHHVARSNGFRKMVNTIMVKAHVEPLIKEMLLGHHTGLEENYYRPEEEDLLNEYLKCVDSLTVSNEFRLKREVEHYKVKASQFDQLRAEIDSLRQMINK